MSNVTHHLDQRQLAERWRMSPRTLERWRWLGLGPSFIKLGKRVAYRLEDIEAFERAHLRAGGEDQVAAVDASTAAGKEMQQ